MMTVFPDGLQMLHEYNLLPNQKSTNRDRDYNRDLNKLPLVLKRELSFVLH